MAKETSKPARLWCLYYLPEDRMLQGLTTEEARAVATSLPHQQKLHWLVWKEKWSLWKSLPDVDELMTPLKRNLSESIPNINRQQSIEDLDERSKSSTEARSGTLSKLLPFETEPPRTQLKSQPKAKTTTEIQGGYSDERIGEITITDASFDLELFEKSAPGSPKRGKQFKARNYTRYPRKLKAIISGPGGRTFETMTMDVSVGGLRVKDSLPGWAIGILHVKLVNESRKQAIKVTCHVLEGQQPGRRLRLSILPLSKVNEIAKFENWLAA